MDIVRLLSRTGKIVIARYPLINSGGCCVYAAMIATELRRYGVKALGIVSSPESPSADIDLVRLKIIKNDIHEWADNSIHFGHIGLEFEIDGKKKHYDANGIRNASTQLTGWKIYTGRLKHSELKTLASRKIGWNTAFDRSHIPAIRKLVRENMSCAD